MATLIVGRTRIHKIRLVLFDKDGTLMDVHTYWAGMVKRRADTICGMLRLGTDDRNGLMTAMGVDPATQRIRREGPVGIKKRDIVLRAGVDYLLSRGHPDRTEAFKDAFAKVDRESELNLRDLVRALPGAEALLTTLRHFNCLAAVATTDLAARAALAMESLGFSAHFFAVAGADTVRETKPAPDMVYHLLDRAGVSPAEAVMIGDAEPDIRCGQNAGLQASIGVASGLCPRAVLEGLTPHVIDSLAEIKVEGDDPCAPLSQ